MFPGSMPPVRRDMHLGDRGVVTAGDDDTDNAPCHSVDNQELQTYRHRVLRYFRLYLTPWTVRPHLLSWLRPE